MNKPEFFYCQSGAIPFRIVENNIEILLITSRTKGNWIIPKGIIDYGLLPQESAIKEALEEAGVEGEISHKGVAEYNVTKWEGICAVKVYLLKVTKIHDSWEEDSFRKRLWVRLEEVENLVKKKKLKKIFVVLVNDSKIFVDAF